MHSKYDFHSHTTVLSTSAADNGSFVDVKLNKGSVWGTFNFHGLKLAQIKWQNLIILMHATNKFVALFPVMETPRA